MELSEGMKSMFKSHAINYQPTSESWERILFPVPEMPEHKFEGYIATHEYKVPLVFMVFDDRKTPHEQFKPVI